MTQYSKMNRGYKYIFTNIDVFSKIANAYPIKIRKMQEIKACFKKYLRKKRTEIYLE